MSCLPYKQIIEQEQDGTVNANSSCSYKGINSKLGNVTAIVL